MIRKLAPGGFVLLLLASCATTPDVKVDADPSANLGAYRTYSWVYSDAPRGMNPLMYQRVRQSIDTYLAGRGYSQASPGDFAVGFTLGARDKVEVDDFGPYGGFYPGYGMGYRWGWAAPYSTTEVRNVTEGTLAIDIYDTASKKPVWHGAASQNVGSTPVTQEQIDVAVSSVLSKFAAPPK